MKTLSRVSRIQRPRALVAWLSVFMVVLAPIIVHLSHGPTATVVTEETAWHGHSHTDIDEGSFVGHDATDHEHHITGLVGQNGDIVAVGDLTGGPICVEDPSGIIRDGPRRPPRFV